MKVYQLTGTHKSGEDWDFSPVFDSYEKAEAKRQIEINAYTYKGVCDWTFEINEIEVA